ncbi:MAG: HlyD family efflux transporter periplasmic adaptor subunit [Vicinamibacterales bacterium]
MLALAGVTWALWPAPILVETVALSRGPLTATVTAEGKTRVQHLYEVSAPVDGTLERVTVQPDEMVTESTVIARIAPATSRPLDPRARAEAEAAVGAARAAVSRADAAEQEATTAAEHAESQLDTARRLVAAGAAPPLDVVHAEHDAEIRRRGVDAARAAARQARADLSRAIAVVATAGGTGGGVAVAVRPPAPGRVLRVIRESGGPVAAGTPLIEVGDVTRLEIVADLLSSDAAQVSPGAAATISGWGGAPLTARVRRVELAGFTKVSALGLEEQRTHVVLDLADAPPASLGHDYRVDVAIAIWQGEDVLRAPSTALFRDGNQWAIYVVRDDRAHAVPVQVGRSDRTWTVIEQGVTEGDIVVVQPSDDVRVGTRVRAVDGGR